MNDNLTHFLTSLSAYKSENVFNPWRDTDADYEVGRAVSIRQEQLTDYLALRIGRAKILLIAEACGYQGGHFSGIAMTCERMLLNQHPKVTSRMILSREGTRTSRMDSPFITKAAQKEKGSMNPPTPSSGAHALKPALPPMNFSCGTSSLSILIKKEISSRTAHRRMKNSLSASRIRKSSSP